MKYKHSIYGLLLFLLQVAVFYYLFCFLFPFKEQLQMFQFTAPYAAGTLKQAGGVALYIAEFISQFYIIIGIGPVITAFLLTGVAVLTASIVQIISNRNDLFFASLFPWLALFTLHLDYYYLDQGTVAYIFSLLFLALYARLKPAGRLVYGLCIIPVLYGIAGPVAFLFAICAFLLGLGTPGNRKYMGLLYIFVAIVCGVTGTYLGYSPDLKCAFLPDAYYDPLGHASNLYYAWYALPLTLLLAVLLKKYKAPATPKGKWIWESIQALTVLFLFYEGITRYGQLETAPLLKQDYYIRNEQWDKVIAAFDPTIPSKRQMCGLNLALARKGELADRLLEFPQGGIETLMLRWDQSVFTAQLHSDLYDCMGIVSTAQKFAFEAFVSSRPSGNPRMLKRLVETNIVMGAYAVAEKYICLLENTWHYRDWAASRRPFLYNDAAVEKDKSLGLKRRCWKAEAASNRLYRDPVSSLTELVQACPQNRAGLQYLTSFLLLNKDIETYRALYEKLYRTPAWPEMSACQQEAVIVSNPNDPRYWLEHGVSLKVRNRSFAFMEKVRAHGAQSNLPALLTADFGTTYWYYYMFYNK